MRCRSAVNLRGGVDDPPRGLTAGTVEMLDDRTAVALRVALEVSLREVARGLSLACCVRRGPIPPGVALSRVELATRATRFD
jgi:hypothetical protein